MALTPSERHQLDRVSSSSLTSSWSSRSGLWVNRFLLQTKLRTTQHWLQLKVMKRASEFERGEEMDLMRQPLEGQLQKVLVLRRRGMMVMMRMTMQFTNPILNWQPRWFCLYPKSGQLRYFLKEEHRKAPKAKPRGSMVTISHAPSLPVTTSLGLGAGGGRDGSLRRGLAGLQRHARHGGALQAQGQFHEAAPGLGQQASRSCRGPRSAQLQKGDPYQLVMSEAILPYFSLYKVIVHPSPY